MGMVLCQVCGNDIKRGVVICPFCGGKQDNVDAEVHPAGILHKVVNLEIGKPLVDVAMRRLRAEIETARSEHLRVLTVIHGYGSSGKGGAIGAECRKLLAYFQGSGEISGFIPGEDFRHRSGPTRDLLRRYPRLATNSNLNKGNRGITLVVL